jgi:hypothetical protein
MNHPASDWLVLIRPLVAGFDSTPDNNGFHLGHVHPNRPAGDVSGHGLSRKADRDDEAIQLYPRTRHGLLFGGGGYRHGRVSSGSKTLLPDLGVALHPTTLRCARGRPSQCPPVTLSPARLGVLTMPPCSEPKLSTRKNRPRAAAAVKDGSTGQARGARSASRNWSLRKGVLPKQSGRTVEEAR